MQRNSGGSKKDLLRSEDYARMPGVAEANVNGATLSQDYYNRNTRTIGRMTNSPEVGTVATNWQQPPSSIGPRQMSSKGPIGITPAFM